MTAGMMSRTLGMGSEGAGQRVTTRIIALFPRTTVALLRGVHNSISAFSQLGDL